MSLIAMVLRWLGGGVLDRFLEHLERRAESDTERMRIATLREKNALTAQVQVISALSSQWWFAIPFLIATVPLSLWFGWGMLDTTFNGALPDVAEIPPGLEPWAKDAWGSLFFSGGAVASASIIGTAIARRR